ncbi:MAG: ComF family protein [Cyanobacteria bacterium P01_H01_bin.105]
MPLPKFLNQLTQVFFAAPCPLCQRSTPSLLCDNCYRQVYACRWSNSTPDNPIHNVSGGIQLSNETTLPVFSWGKYQGGLKQILALLKYGNQAELGIWLGCQLGQQWRVSNPHSASRPVVVPIPLHSQRLRERGYNQAALIAQGFCRVTGLPWAEHGLIRIKATDAMHRLGLNERQSNLAGAFQLGNELSSRQRPILLVDDIYTTGTTGNMVAVLLMRAGYTVLGIATVARAVLLPPVVGLPRPCHPHQILNSHPSL